MRVSLGSIKIIINQLNLKTMKEAEKLINQLQAILTESLPLHVGEALQKRLKVADDLEIVLEDHLKTIKEKEKLIEKKDEKISKLEDTINAHNDITVREREVKAREQAADKREMNAELEKVKYQLEAEKDKTGFTKEVALGLVKNTVYRKTVFDSENQAPYQMPSLHGGTETVWPNPINKSLTETKTQE